MWFRLCNNFNLRLENAVVEKISVERPSFLEERERWQYFFTLYMILNSIY